MKRLVFIHIGKCGGETVWRAVSDSPVLKFKFDKVERVHIKKPIYDPSAYYLFCVRNPVKRAISAFNWRKHLVQNDSVQASRFPGEFHALRKYQTINELGMALMVDGQLSLEAYRDWLSIHHLKEDIAFYLEEIVPFIRPEQIFGVLHQETLRADITNVLGVKEIESYHSFGQNLPKKYIELCEASLRNISHILYNDFNYLKSLSKKYPLSAHSY